MFRIILGVLGVNFTLFGVSELRGIPLTLFVFSVLYTLGVLPVEVRTQGGGPSVQTWCRYSCSKTFCSTSCMWPNTRPVNCASHRIHHTRTHPKTADALHAGSARHSPAALLALFVS